MSNFNDRCDENECSREEISRLKKLLRTKWLTKAQKNEIEMEIEWHEISMDWNEECGVPNFF